MIQWHAIMKKYDVKYKFTKKILVCCFRGIVMYKVPAFSRWWQMICDGEELLLALTWRGFFFHTSHLISNNNIEMSVRISRKTDTRAAHVFNRDLNSITGTCCSAVFPLDWASQGHDYLIKEWHPRFLAWHWQELLNIYDWI